VSRPLAGRPAEARHRRLAADTTGGAAGNERLTAMTGAVLLVLLAAEGFTLLGVHRMLTLHFFLGMLLIGPVLLKIGSTGYRLWLFAHKAFFVLWFAAMTAHVVWYAPQLPRLLAGISPQAERVERVLAGAGKRWLLLVAALVAGLVLALATYHLAGNWTGLAH
jgi:hypothetical protein